MKDLAAFPARQYPPRIETIATPIAGLMVLAPLTHHDGRGSFTELWNAESFARAGITASFVQDNLSRSLRRGVVRGLHCQIPPRTQGKLVTCLAGAIFDVAVDIRPGSPTFGRWFGIELKGRNGLSLWIPPGFLHGFVTRTDDTLVLYKCTAPWSPAHERTVRWDDPDLAIDWGLSPAHARLSPRDVAAPPFRAADLGFSWPMEEERAAAPALTEGGSA